MRNVVRVLIAAFLVGAAPLAWRAAASPASAAPPILEDDAAAIADLYGLSIDMARTTLKLEEGVSGLAEQAKALLADDFAGLWLTHTPSFAVHISGVGDHSADVASLVAGTPYVGITFFETVENSLKELGELAANSPEWVSVPHDLEIDVVNNQVIVYLREADRGRASARRGVDVKYLKQLTRPAVDIYGGIGGLSGGCTTGFTVRAGTMATGVTTAAHCANAESLNGTSVNRTEFRGGIADWIQAASLVAWR